MGLINRSSVAFASLVAVIVIVPSWMPAALSGAWGATPVFASAPQSPAAPTNVRVVRDPEGNWAVVVSSLTSSSATIAWKTIAPGDTQVEYGVTRSFGSASPLDPTLVTSHAVTLTGLSANTIYYFRAQSRDASGHLNKSSAYSFKTLAASDTTAPAVSISAPAAGATLSGSVAVSATATDDVAVAGVQFKLDGANLGAEDTAAPYGMTWNTTTAANGAHSITAVARDSSGNARTSAAVTVTVANDSAAPLISAVTATSITTSGATIRWTTNEASDSQVQYGTTIAYGSTSTLNPSLLTAHATVLTGLSANTLYHYQVRSRDASGNLATSGDFTFTTATPADTIAPTIALTAPAAGATVSGTVAVSATASDNVGVAGVQFRVDGAALGSEDTASPYEVSWNTGNATSGAHTLTAVARDAAGNTRTSAAVTVTVSNGLALVVSPADTSLNLDATNYSATTLLTTYTWPAQSVANAIIMKFDLSGLPAGTVVQSATLHLALVESDATADATYSVAAHKIVGRNPAIAGATGYTSDGATPWTANACCSNNVPMAQADISPAYDTQTIDKTPGLKSWTLTTMVQEWLADPFTNFGVLLNSDATALADRYRYFASMEHADPQLRPYLRITYTVAPGDSTPPTASMTAPVSGAIVSGPVTVAASASDNVGVVAVQFKVDGANLGVQDTTPPYSVVWDTAAVANGSHTLVAVARDAAGNQTTSGAVTVTVSNTAPPSGWTNEPSGFTVIEETGWEDGTLGNWYRIFTSADKPISVKPITSSPIGESRTLQIDYLAGHVGGGGTELRYDIPSALRSNELYVGYYVQVNPAWQGHSSGINKMIYLHDGGANFAAMWYEIFGSGSGPLDLYLVNQSGSSPSGMHENVNAITFVRGQWHKVEIYQKQGSSNNGIIRVWVDGVLALDRSDVDTTANPVDNVTISGIWGGVGDSKNQADFMRFDRIRISRPGAGAPPPPPPSTALFEETFEDANLASRGWYDDPAPLLSTAEHIPGSVRSIEYRFNAGSTTPTAAVALRRKFTPSNSVYLRYHVKYSTNWVGSQRPYHPHEFHFLTNLEGDWSGLSFTHLTAYIEQNGGTPLIGIQDGANVDQARVGQDLTAITEWRGVAGCNGSSDGYPDNCYMGGSGYVNEKKWTAAARYFTDTPGAYYKSDWHLVEAYVKLNTISGGRGINDGVIQYWFDGQLIIDRRNVLLRTGANPDALFNQIVIAPYIGDGSPVTQSFWVDNVLVATGRP